MWIFFYEYDKHKSYYQAGKRTSGIEWQYLYKVVFKTAKVSNDHENEALELLEYTAMGKGA